MRTVLVAFAIMLIAPDWQSYPVAHYGTLFVLGIGVGNMAWDYMEERKRRTQ